jgi:type II secretory pathway component GspD/PulD (secretin)
VVGQESLPAQNFSVPQTQIIPVKPLGLNIDNRIQLQSDRDMVTLVTRDAPLSTVLSMIAQQQNLNIVTGEEVSERINVTLKDVRLDDALNSILAVHGYTWARQNNIITVSSMTAERRTSPNVQGRIIRVFTLNYVLGSDVDKVVKGLMSPLGQSFINQTSKTEQRNAHEQLVVEDLPPYVDRIASYIAQIDILPRQVVVESNVLQVTLKDNNRHGVNFKQLAEMNNSQITLETTGLASTNPPTSTMRVNSTDLTSLIELLKATNDTKTLASPKVAVLNGQEARISVGGKLGYLQTTATTTSTLQSVSFLDFGVVLKVVPIITEDGQILLTVSPQVSTGRINPTSKLPESESTEVETTVMLSDGQAIVIGGLIKETSSDNQNKIPFLGDLWVVGRLFQSRETLRERNEIIITLLPRIARPGDACWSAIDSQVAQATTPLMTRNLTPIDRTAWEGELPDSGRRSKKSWNWFRRPKKAVAPAVEVSGATPITPEPSPPIEFDNSYYAQPIINYPPSSPPLVPNNAMDYSIPVTGAP